VALEMTKMKIQNSFQKVVLGLTVVVAWGIPSQ
jgi:hypothetical protein